MISYQWDDQEYCIKMKDYLIGVGYQVWMDIENMHGSILDAMSSAIERSICIIMCMSHKYKESINCKLEAEYAHCKKIRIIPLIMQSKYKPDGWLVIS